MSNNESYSSKCPSCGAPVEAGASPCPNCGAEIGVRPDFEHSDVKAEQDMKRLLINEKNVRGFYARLNAHIDQEITKYGKTNDVFDPKLSEMLAYQERVLNWLESNEGAVGESHRVSSESQSAAEPINELKKRIKDSREVYVGSFLSVGWPELILRNEARQLELIPQQKSSEVILALQDYVGSNNKSVSGEAKPGLMTPADKLIKVFFTGEMIHTVKAIVVKSHEASQSQAEKKQGGGLFGFFRRKRH